jgi:Tfp pilus assembly protein PilV
MDKHSKQRKGRRPDAGITMIETLMAAGILVIGSVGLLALVVADIATNNRNKIDSTQTMLAEAILEQISSTFGGITQGPGTSSLVDCAGHTWTIDTTASGTGSSGSPLSGANIDFSQAQVTNWSMNYVVSSPCSISGAVQGTYDVRWHLDQIGTTQTYLITVAAKLLGHGEGNEFFSLPVTLRFLAGS